jgi:hypothetical protein
MLGLWLLCVRGCTLGTAVPALRPVHGIGRAAFAGIGCRRGPLVAALVTRARRAIGVHAVRRRRGGHGNRERRETRQMR